MIEKAKNQSNNEIKNQLIQSQQIISNEETFYEEMTKKFSTKERSQMKLYSLDNYCLFIASRYFETIDDHINFSMTCKRLCYNMEKFHYNPISLSQDELHYLLNKKKKFFC